MSDIVIITAIKAELDADTLVRGYAGMTDEEATDDLNTAYRSRNRTSMTGKEVKDAIDTGEWDSRSAAQRQELLAMVARDDLDPFGIDAHILTEAMTGAGGVTVAALAAARVETISRAQELWGMDLVVGDIQHARSL